MARRELVVFAYGLCWTLVEVGFRSTTGVCFLSLYFFKWKRSVFRYFGCTSHQTMLYLILGVLYYWFRLWHQLFWWMNHFHGTISIEIPNPLLIWRSYRVALQIWWNSNRCMTNMLRRSICSQASGVGKHTWYDGKYNGDSIKCLVVRHCWQHFSSNCK